MSLTAQDIINSASQDARSLLGTSGGGANILLDYVDRIHKDVLHSSIHSNLNHAGTTVQTVVGQTSYTLTPTDIRRILTCYDTTTNRMLEPLIEATTPVPQAEDTAVIQALPQTTAPPAQAAPRELVRTRFASALPEYYGMRGSNTLILLPVPQQVVNVEVGYEMLVSSLTATTDPLTVPDDGKGMLVAGVNYLAAVFVGRSQEANFWAALYEKLKRGEALA